MKMPKFSSSSATINGRQINLLIARGIDKGLRGSALLEFLEFDCDVQVTKLEEVPTTELNQILQKLENLQ